MRKYLIVFALWVTLGLTVKVSGSSKGITSLNEWERNREVDRKVYKIADELEWICKKNRNDYEAVMWSPTAVKLIFELDKMIEEHGEVALAPIYDIAKDKGRSILLRILMEDRLGFSKNTKGVKAVISFLIDKSEDERMRINAADLLGRIKDTLAVPYLIQVMKDKTNPERVRWEAAHAFVFIPDKRAIKPLLDNIQSDPSVDVKRISISALGMIGKKTGDRSMVEVLLEIVKKDEGVLQYHAISALGAMRERRVLPLLIERVEQNKRRNLDVVIWALGNIGGSEAKRALVKLLNDEDEIVRFDAAKALIKMGDKSVIPEIEKVLPKFKSDGFKKIIQDSLKALKKGKEQRR